MRGVDGACARRYSLATTSRLGALSDARGGIMSELLLDAAGRRRSPATLPEFHAGRPPRNKGMRYPADPPTIEEIVTVMRHAGDGVHGRRLRGLVVVLWRAGCGSVRRSRSPRPTSIRGAVRCWSGAARVAGAARWGWTTGRGSSSNHGSRRGSSCRSDCCSASSMVRHADGRGQPAPPAQNCVASPARPRCVGALRRTSSATRMPSRWPAKACR
jgi:hypothetical protein